MAYEGPNPLPPHVGGTGEANADTSTITLGGALTTTPAHAITFTTTGATGVTLPTSGTLATTSQLPTLPLTVANGGTGDSTITGVLVGSGTSNITGTAITQYNVITGGATNLPNSVAPGATSGVPLISQGAASQPLFGTAVVAGGGTGATTLTGVLIGNGTSPVTGNAITQHDVLIGGATNAITSVAPSATSGVPLISQGASSDPAFGTATVPGGGTGAVTLTGVLTGNGTSAITASAITQYDVLVGGATNAVSSVGPGTSGQLLQSKGNAANPAYTTATYPSTTTANQILYSNATNTVTGLTTANDGVLTTGATGVPVITALAADGDLIIGSSAGAPTASTLTAGSGITITNGHNSITIAASGGSGITTIDGNSGSVTGSTVTITGGTSGAVFTGSGTTLTESFEYLKLPSTDNSGNGKIYINSVPYLQAFTPSAGDNLFLGANSGNTTFSATENTNAIGASTLHAMTSGDASRSVVIGDGCLASLNSNSSTDSVSIGYNVLNAISAAANQNVTIGSSTLPVWSSHATTDNVTIGYSILNVDTGTNSTPYVGNVVLGSQALLASTGSDMVNNVIIGYQAISLGIQPYLDHCVGIGYLAFNSMGLDSSTNNISTTVSIGSNILQANTGHSQHSQGVFIGNSLFNSSIDIPYDLGVYIGANIGNTMTENMMSLGHSVMIGNNIISAVITDADFGTNVLIGSQILNTTTSNSDVQANVIIGNNILTAATGSAFYLHTSVVLGSNILSAYNDVSDSIQNIVAIGTNVLASYSAGPMNPIVAIGYNSCATATGASSGIVNCVAVGNQTLAAMATSTNDCTAIGDSALKADTSGTYNTAVGSQALVALNGGTNNVAYGYNAGSAYTSTESSNIVIGNIGTASESHVVRIGAQGSGTGQQSTCYISGITGATVVGTAVLCSATGQLGTISSSERYKENIESIGSTERLLKLRPVSFHYKSEEEKTIHYGLIAEEVEKVLPELVVYNTENLPESVKYHEMPALLLAEIQNLRAEIEILKIKMGV